MVFSGRPSKACQRCRDRRLKCDIRTPSCGSCDRANTQCTGYRDAKQLRIRDESQKIRRKVMLLSPVASPEPRTLLLSLQAQARDAFFMHYVSGLQHSWDFIKDYYYPSVAPDHLTLTIDAVSLAFLAHQLYSDSALEAAREKYVAALQLTHRAIKCPRTAVKETTLFTSLLLDLFEKITNNERKDTASWASHVNGALALLKLRGLDHFEDCSPGELRVLGRLGTNLLISCVAGETRPPDELYLILDYAGKQFRINDPKLKLTNLMITYANIRWDSRTNSKSKENIIDRTLKLDGDLFALAFSMPPSWKSRTTFVDYDSERIYGRHFDSYPDRHFTQTWNVSRLVRIILNEAMIDSYEANTIDSPTGPLPLLEPMKTNIEAMGSEICASVPQYLDCRYAISRPECSNHIHTPAQNLDCYTLIFPLYVVGWSKSTPDTLKSWVIGRLHYMGSHFGIRNAELVGQILERGENLNPWAVYALIGSYAFVA